VIGRRSARHSARYWTAALPLLFLAACVSNDNRPIIEKLEERAQAHPDETLETYVRVPSPYWPVTESQLTVLPMASAKVPVVQGAINGVEMPLLLDTGTTHVVVSGPAARDCELYLPPGHSVALLTPGYEARYHVGAPSSIRLGNTRLEGGIAVVSERESGLARRLGVRARSHATIGVSVLSNFRIVLDFGKREVTLDPHGGQPFTGVLWTEAKVNGRRCLLLVDSGANGIFLEPSFAHALGLIDAAEEQRHHEKADSAATARFTQVEIERLAIGEHEFEGIRAHVVNLVDEYRDIEALPRGGLLGLAGLGPHRWTIDYSNAQLILEKAR